MDTMFSISLLEKSYVELKLFSWDGRYVKEKQPQLEEVLAPPLFSLGKVTPIFFFPLRNVLVT